MKFSGAFALVAMTLPFIVSCKGTHRNASSELNATGEIPAYIPEKIVSLGNTYQALNSSEVEIDLDSTGNLSNVTMDYSSSAYKVPVIENGVPKVNDEGKTYYKDGIYIKAFLLTTAGQRVQLDRTRFVDGPEIDNWHDLNAPKGSKLIIQFSVAQEYRSDPQVQASNPRVTLKSVTLRYKDAPGLVSKDFIYNSDYDNEMPANAIELPAGGTHSVTFPKSYKVYRVDVRWGDAKPRNEAGHYVPGTASGALLINGVQQGPARQVAALETESWGPLNLPTGAGDNTFSINLKYDKGRVHSIRLFYVPQ